MTRDLVYGRQPVRELLRGPRELLEVWATERAAAQIPWLDSGPRPQIKHERLLSDAAGTRDHQGIVAWCEPFRYADAHALAAEERPLLVCLDQVTDPHNLGAVVRSAEGAGATGVVVPAHGSVRVTPAVCRSSAGAVEHLPVAVVPNLARYLAEIKGPGLWAYAADSEGSLSMWSADLTGGVALVLGAEGKGVRPLVRRTCDAVVSIPARRSCRLAERQRRSCSAPVRVETPAGRRRLTMADPTLYLFDGYNVLHAGSFTSPEDLIDVLASFVAQRGARGVAVFDGAGEDSQIGPLSVRYAAHADDLLERLAAAHRVDELVCVVSSDDAVRRVSGQEVRTLSSRLFLVDLQPAAHREREQRGAGSRVGDRLDEKTREQLERLRRAEDK